MNEENVRFCLVRRSIPQFLEIIHAIFVLNCVSSLFPPYHDEVTIKTNPRNKDKTMIIVQTKVIYFFINCKQVQG